MPSEVDRMFFELEPERVIHLAGKVGGIGANKQFPADFIHDNLLMGLNVINYASKYKVNNFVLASSVCGYPQMTTTPMKEVNFWNGQPEETNRAYGIAKRTLVDILQAYSKQYNMVGISLLFANMYGPGDNFNLLSSHVIPALITKFDHAIQNNTQEVTIWGDGSATRDFLYVEDAATVILKSVNEKDSLCANVGSGKEITIYELAQTIKGLMNYQGKIVWDSSKPNGQIRRSLDTSKAQAYLDFKAETPLVDGLKNTIEYYRSNVLCPQ